MSLKGFITCPTSAVPSVFLKRLDYPSETCTWGCRVKNDCLESKSEFNIDGFFPEIYSLKFLLAPVQTVLLISSYQITTKTKVDCRILSVAAIKVQGDIFKYLVLSAQNPKIFNLI